MIRMTHIAVIAALCVACEGDGADGPSGDAPEVLELTIDASDPEAFVTVDFADGSLGSDLGDMAWDVAFRGTTVRVNSGPSGPGNAAVGLMATPFGVPDDEAAIRALTPESTEDLFTDELGIPSPQMDEVISVIDDSFYNYDASSGDLTENDAVGYLIRKADGAGYARLRVTNIDFLTRSGNGVESFTLSLEPDEADDFGEAVEFTSSLPDAGSVCFSLDTEAVADCDTPDWDVRFGYFGRTTFIYPNGGDVGPGDGAVLGPVDWSDLETWTSPTQDPSGQDRTGDYDVDRIVGPFDEAPWFVELSDGTFPTHRIYYVEPGDDGDSYVLQILGADDPASEGPWRLRYYAL
ncbi:MAG: HmuY family protein [Myxococcota bacterium]